MGLADFEVLFRERLAIWNPTLDVSEGSPVDGQVIQPLLRRLGTDPFTVDMSTFIVDRLSQEFPDLATTDGDAVSDLLVKPALVLWDPIIREIQRIKSQLSFRDPATLTLDEVEALGANIFAERDRGNYARGTARVYFAQAQQASITQANFITSRANLHFFPDGAQSIRLDEMLMNVEGELYYFDVTFVAERAGDEYNIGPSEIVTIANVPAAVRITNKVRFRFGLPEQDAVSFAEATRQDLSERSLVTLRGINAKITRSFPEVTRLAVVGFQDPEMQRDVLTGGSLGQILAFGNDASTQSDGEFKTLTRRVRMSSAHFLTQIGPVGPTSGFVVTLFGMFGASPPLARDLAIVRVISDTVVELAEQVLVASSGKTWCLRRRELTLSGIPGGIVIPDNENGTVSITPDQVHIGGCTDILTRGADFDTDTLVIDTITDDDPLLSGVALDLSTQPGLAVITDLTRELDYQVGDTTYEALTSARLEQYTFEILEGVAAGVYRVLDVSQPMGGHPTVTLDPTPLAAPGAVRWRLLDDVDIDLVEPKETRIGGSSGATVQNLFTFTTSPTIDFDALGVSVGDILRISNGSVAGDYVVEEVASPLFTQVRVDRPFSATQAGLSFKIFRRNGAGAVKRPLLRVTSVDLLDTTGQPVGTTVPYAKPVDARSRAFQNPGSGQKVETTLGVLGIVSLPEPVGGFVFGATKTLSLTWDNGNITITASFTGTRTLVQVRDALNAVSQSLIAQDICTVVNYNNQTYLGFIPVGANTRTTGPSSAHDILFGDSTVRTSRDIRTTDVPDWHAVSPAIDEDLDAAWVLDGFQSGFYSDLTYNFTGSLLLGASTALRVSHDFSPELFQQVRVGARSLGSARVYFLDPTSIEVDQKTKFTLEGDDGSLLTFKPDPTIRFQKLPALPNADKPKNGVTNGANTFSAVGYDFVKKGVREGDVLVIDFIPRTGSATLADPVPNLALKNLRISLDGQPDKVVTFVNDVATAGAVSRQGVVDQINNAIGLNIASLVNLGSGGSDDFRLVFNPELLFILRQQATSTSMANVILGFSNAADTQNRSPNFGKEWTVLQVGSPSATSLVVDTSANGPFSAATAQQFKVFRTGGQRISSSEMIANVAEAGLYYWDVELVSEGTGDLWNIDADEPLVMEQFRSDGYYLTTANPNTSFSPVEDVTLHLSRSILELGVDDDPENATQLTGQSISVSYEYSSAVGNVQSFITSDQERVVNQSPLARHLVPHYVRFDISYAGGSKATEVTPDLERYIRLVPPGDALESSDIQGILASRGASSVENPISMIAVVYNFDRTVNLARSENALTTGRLAAFVPDRLNVTRRAGG